MRGGLHFGRTFSGHHLEDGCPCGKAPCGLIDADHIDPTCLDHPVSRGKTIRQAHEPARCPAGDHTDERTSR